MRAETDTTSRRRGNPAERRVWAHPRRAILLGLLPAAAIAAACGSSSTSTTNTTKATTSTTASAAPAVQTANNSKFGTILVDSQGRTLYTLTNPSSGAGVACTSSACLAVWPAATLPAGQTTVSTGPGVSNVTAVSFSGGQQLAYKGLPLHRFQADVSSGAANGDGINSFGGIWHVVKLSGGGTAAPAGGTSTTSSGGAGTTATTSRGGGSYGGY